MMNVRKVLVHRFTSLVALLLVASHLSFAGVPQLGDEKVIESPQGVRMSVKVNAPYLEPADLQIVCIFKHNPAGDKYIEAMKDFDDKLGHIVSGIRDRGEFIGDLGETFLIDSASSIPAKRVMLIGIGAEKDLSIEALRVAGRVAAREAVRLRAKTVGWAPTLRDQGNKLIEVGAGDAAFAKDFLLAYDTEKRLQTQGLAPFFDVESCVIEAGPTYFESASEKVMKAVADAATQIATRDNRPYGKPAAK